MTQQIITPNKMRWLVGGPLRPEPPQGAQAPITAPGDYPPLPDITVEGIPVFKGDFTGARIAGFVANASNYAGVTSIGLTIIQSPDLWYWYDYLVFTPLADGVKQAKMLDSADDQPMKYLAARITAAAGAFGSADMYVQVLFNQVGAKGKYAPPGKPDKLD